MNLEGYRVLRHNVDPDEYELLREVIDENYASWCASKKDCYIEQYSDMNPYSIECVHTPKRVLVLVHLGDCLGNGEYSEVRKTVDFLTGELFAHKTRNPKSNVQPPDFDKEYALYEQFRGCANVVQAVHRTAQGILFEYMDGDLSKFRYSSDLERQAVCTQVAFAVSEIHSKGFVHRDVKRSNFLFRRAFDGTVEVKIADIGGAVQQYTEVPLQGFMSHCSLRLVQIKMMHVFNRKDNTYFPEQADDLHALAITLYEIENGRLPPFCQIIYKIMYALDKSLVERPQDLVPDFRQLGQQIGEFPLMRRINELMQFVRKARFVM